MAGETALDDRFEYEQFRKGVMWRGRWCIWVGFGKVNVNIYAALGRVAIIFKLEAVVMLMIRFT